MAKAFVVVIFIGIVASLGSGMVYLIRDKGGSDRAVRALTMRIGLSVVLFLLLLVMYGTGLISPHGF